MLGGGDDRERIVRVAVAHVVDAEDLAFHRALAARDVDVVAVLQVPAEILVGHTGGIAHGSDAVGGPLAEDLKSQRLDALPERFGSGARAPPAAFDGLVL